MVTSAAPLDVRQFIDERAIGATQWLILALCMVAALLDGFDTAAMGYVAPALVQGWGVARTQLGPVMSAALVGMAVGGLIAGPLGDRLGRKWVMIIAAILFGLTTLAAAMAGSLQSLAILRLVAGVGFGAVLPNAAALLGEYSPGRHRPIMVSLMFCGLTLGYSASGFAAAVLIPHYGWQSMFVVGGTLPLLLAVCLAWLMPESARFMVAIGRSRERIAATLARLAPDARALLERTPEFLNPVHANVAVGHPIRTILSPPLLLGTLLLWLVYFGGLVVVFLMSSWLPTLLKDGGYSMSAAANLSGLFQLGGTVGSLLVAWLMGRVGSYRAIASAYALAGISILVMSRSLHGSLGALGALVVVSGFFTSGAQTPMNALAIGFYPTAARSTGTGWMLGVGRFGAILGSYIGAPLLAMGLGFSSIIAGLAIPLAIAASAITCMGLLYRRQP